MTNTLIPSYLETDFSTLKSKLIALMQQSDTFKDYNYEGANITMLMELVSYIGDLNTFYNNVIAKNVFPDTADIYEVVHSQTSHLGFYPRGWRSAVTWLQITLNKEVEGETDSYVGDGLDKLYIPAWFTINTNLQDEDGNVIYYCTTKDFYLDIPQTDDTQVIFEIPLRQGEPEHLSYTGDDIIDNQLILPFYQFDHEVYPYRDDLPCIELKVDDEQWIRIPDFYDRISGLESVNEDDVYMFKYNKYERYLIEWNSIRNTPSETSQIDISLIKSLGPDGSIGSGLITESPEEDEITSEKFLTNIRPGGNIVISTDFYTVTNLNSSIGGHLPDTIQQLKEGGKLEIHSQKRNVNRWDYIGSLQNKGDIVKANVWGENEIDPGNTDYYNKVYMSVIPDSFDESTIDTITIPASGDEFTGVLSGTLEIPSEYNTDWKASILEFIEPRKYLCTHEIFVLPELVYFKFDIGIKTKRLYYFENVKNDLLTKLEYYFLHENRDFYEIIDFRNLHNWLLDSSIILPGNRFSNMRGIDSLVFRDVVTFTYSNTNPINIYPYDSEIYPRFTKEDYGTDIDNTLRPIQLGFNQFPELKKEFCIIKDES